MAFAGVEVSEHIFAAGFIALMIAGQCLRNEIWLHGFEAFSLRRARAEA